MTTPPELSPKTTEQRFSNSPPHLRSRKAAGLTAAAAQGRFALQVCEDCQQVCYPAREICPKCWSMQLEWQDVATGGQLIAETTLRNSTNAYFRDHMPWRIGTVALDAGPTVLAHIHGEVGECARVKMIARTDKSGQGVLMALPENDTPGMADDRQLRTLTCNPKDCRVLVTDGRGDLGQQIVKALADAGASQIFVALVEDTDSARAEFKSVSAVEIVTMDVAASDSVNKLAAKIGDKTDILINTAGSSGLPHLIEEFGPCMQARGDAEDGGAWVNLLPVSMLSEGPSPERQAAALSPSLGLRSEFAGSGVKVINVLFGPPRSARSDAGQVAEAAVHALAEGIEIIPLGPEAEELAQLHAEV